MIQSHDHFLVSTCMRKHTSANGQLCRCMTLAILIFHQFVHMNTKSYIHSSHHWRHKKLWRGCIPRPKLHKICLPPELSQMPTLHGNVLKKRTTTGNFLRNTFIGTTAVNLYNCWTCHYVHWTSTSSTMPN